MLASTTALTLLGHTLVAVVKATGSTVMDALAQVHNVHGVAV